MAMPRDVGEFLIDCGLQAGRGSDPRPLERLYEHLVAANRTTNLTRITSEEDYWRLHVADSLSIGLVWPELLSGPLTVADVGCGAGFPTLPLAWANPALSVTGIESRGKKAAFVAEQARVLGLSNAAVVEGRARDVARTPARAGKYDAVLLRAVGDSARLLRECRGLLKPRAGSRIVFYKTPAAVAAERDRLAREAGKLGFSVIAPDPFSLPSARGTRQFILLER
ncbi:MAG TPA: 16S rRNA (guanine(527)-N(7))-methyltransferase RsmG [Phycisphaerae bacterium]|nr:16S rRNA (guanine(527)-N(7))-methyltransferase RsmG [Phycisphaerae bacterium]